MAEFLGLEDGKWTVMEGSFDPSLVIDGEDVKKDGGKIVMDGKTAKNGVMILKHIKNIIFKGAPKKVYYNKQYNFASNPYKHAKHIKEGERLSLVIT